VDQPLGSPQPSGKTGPSNNSRRSDQESHADSSLPRRCNGARGNVPKLVDKANSASKHRGPKNVAYSVLLQTLSEFLAQWWHPGSELCAYTAEGDQCKPESEQAVWFSISGACRKLFIPDEACHISYAISSINAEVFGHPCTYAWESAKDRTIEDVQRIVSAVAYVYSEPSILKLIDQEPRLPSRKRLREQKLAKVRAIFEGLAQLPVAA
jgi:hypothetical protein